MTYFAKLKTVIKRNRSNLVIGLDSDINKIPLVFKKYKSPVLEFNKHIITSTKNIVAGYKINTAFYEAEGSKGFDDLEKTASFIPDYLIKICDAKRGDIENTDEYYAEAFFDKFNFDAVTVHPYLGKDSIIPFLRRDNKFVYILALTSNPGSGDFQKIRIGKKYLFEKIIEISLTWSSGKIGFVIGANHFKFLKKFTFSSPDVPVLIPGIGSQGNDIKKLMSNLYTNTFLINSSRSIIYSANSNCTLKEFDDTVSKTALILNSEINRLKRAI